MITYTVELANVRAHLFGVTLTVPRPAAEQRLSLPVWIPGSYLVREFARHLSSLTATQAGRPVLLRQIDKTTWVARCSGPAPLVLGYTVYAFDTSVRAAFLDSDRGFFNGTSVCLRVEGREAEPHRLELTALPADWQVATVLAAPAAGDVAEADIDADPEAGVPTSAAAVFQADSYHALVDSPFELGRFWRGRFVVGGVPHDLVVTGAWPGFDGYRLLSDTARICGAEIRFWHGQGSEPGRNGQSPPFDRYLFLLNAVDDGHGGLEHRCSTALIAPRRDLPQMGRSETGDGYATLLGLISHEYFHTWSVKRLRPVEFTELDYTRENYTELLWFFEGFTSYYDDLFLLRTGLIDFARYLKFVARTVSSVLATPGRKAQSVAASSFDAWIKYYRSDENTPNATISYYAKGSLVALALDLTLRLEGHGTLDQVMRHLWNASRGGPIDEAAIASALRQVGQRSYAAELAEWVHGTSDLPLPGLLERIGVAWQHSTATVAQRLGVRVAESPLTGIKVSQVQRGGAAEGAGLAVGDEVLALQGWRLRRLEEALRLVEPGVAAQLLVTRDQRLQTLVLTLPADDAAEPAGAVVLQPDPKATAAALALQKAWLAS